MNLNILNQAIFILFSLVAMGLASRLVIAYCEKRERDLIAKALKDKKVPNNANELAAFELAGKIEKDMYDNPQPALIGLSAQLDALKDTLKDCHPSAFTSISYTTGAEKPKKKKSKKKSKKVKKNKS